MLSFFICSVYFLIRASILCCTYGYRGFHISLVDEDPTVVLSFDGEYVVVVVVLVAVDGDGSGGVESVNHSHTQYSPNSPNIQTFNNRINKKHRQTRQNFFENNRFCFLCVTVRLLYVLMVIRAGSLSLTSDSSSMFCTIKFFY